MTEQDRSAPYTPIILSEEEIAIRAREAAIAAGHKVGTEGSEWAEAVRAGEKDDFWLVVSAAQALRDLSKPLDQIQPTDPDLVEARRIVATTLTPERHKGCRCRAEIVAGGWDNGHKVRAALAAIKRGRELASGDRT